MIAEAQLAAFGSSGDIFTGAPSRGAALRMRFGGRPTITPSVSGRSRKRMT
jgi:hypothetical protein